MVTQSSIEDNEQLYTSNNTTTSTTTENNMNTINDDDEPNKNNNQNTSSQCYSRSYEYKVKFMVNVAIYNYKKYTSDIMYRREYYCSNKCIIHFNESNYLSDNYYEDHLKYPTTMFDYTILNTIKELCLEIAKEESITQLTLDNIHLLDISNFHAISEVKDDNNKD